MRPLVSGLGLGLKTFLGFVRAMPLVQMQKGYIQPLMRGALDHKLHVFQLSSAPEACGCAVVTVAVKLDALRLVFSKLNPHLKRLSKMSALAREL